MDISGYCAISTNDGAVVVSVTNLVRRDGHGPAIFQVANFIATTGITPTSLTISDEDVCLVYSDLSLALSDMATLAAIDHLIARMDSLENRSGLSDWYRRELDD